jgi:hypothetical protein
MSMRRSRYVYTTRAAQTPEQVELVRNHLRFRSQVGLPTYLLVDDVGYRTQLWPDIAQACAAVGIPVLAAARNEDWYRFVRRAAWSTRAGSVASAMAGASSSRCGFIPWNQARAESAASRCIKSCVTW